MKKILILGATGMLGSAVYDFLKERYKLVLSVRDPGKLELLDKKYGGTGNHQAVVFDASAMHEDFVNKKGYPGEYFANFIKQVGDVDYAINCLGITIPYAMEDQAQTLFINGAFPHILAWAYGPKLIHITTDCVYDGKAGFPYSEDSPKTPTDIYSLSKSLGEPENCLTLRTSIIGRELEGFTGLLEWFLQQEGKEIGGFSSHYWNGITTKQFAKICDQIISDPDRYPQSGIYHIFSNPVSKHEMLTKFKEKFGINCFISENPEPKLNRTLTTVKPLNSLFNIPSFDQMLKET